MKRLITFFLFIALANFMPMGAEASTPAVRIQIDISSQSMAVNVNGWSYGRWRISTARSGYHTPRGFYRPFLLKRMHYSRKYDNSPMPNSIFFLGGYAIHGTGYVRSLGRPASHGCIRLAPANAARLYYLVQKHGLGATRISIAD
ncbi:MAG TPA: L,D-transpeptidase [Aestuariivirga sp.]|nr:L,D-transpeptidase [Aestuariivirga sp.]